MLDRREFIVKSSLTTIWCLHSLSASPSNLLLRQVFADTILDNFDKNSFENEILIQAGKLNLLKDPTKYKNKLIRSNIAQSYYASLSSIQNPSRQTKRKYRKLISNTLDLSNPLKVDYQKLNKGLNVLLKLNPPNFSTVNDEDDFATQNRNLRVSTLVLGTLLSVYPPTSIYGVSLVLAGSIVSEVPELSPFRLNYQSIDNLTQENDFFIRSTQKLNEKNKLDESFEGNRDKIGLPKNPNITEVINNLPTELRKFISDELSKIKSSSKEDLEKLSGDIQDYFDKKISKVVKKSFEEINLKKINDLVNAEKKRKEKIIEEQEIKSSIYLTGVLLDTLGFKDEARFITGLATEIYNAYKLTSSLASIGTMTAVAGYVGIAIAIYGLFSRKKKSNGIGKALRQISKQIQSLREEMHLRFDAIEYNQRIIIDSIEKIALEINKSDEEISKSLNDIITNIHFDRKINYDNLQDAKINKLRLGANQLRTQFGYKNNLAEKYHRPTVDENLTILFDYAFEVSEDKIFTGSSYDTLDDIIENDVLESMRIDSSLNLLNLFQSYYNIPIDVKSIRNPIEFSRGATSFCTHRLMFQEVKNTVYDTNVKLLYFEALRLRETLKIPTSKPFVEKIINSFYIELNTFLDSMKVKIDVDIVSKELGLKHLFTSMPTMKTKVLEKTKVLNVSERIPSNSFLLKESSDWRFFGEFFKIDTSKKNSNPIQLAELMGLITLKKKNTITRLIKGLHFIKEAEEIVTIYEIKFHHKSMNRITSLWHSSNVRYYSGGITNKPKFDPSINISYLPKEGVFNHAGYKIDDTLKFLKLLEAHIKTVYFEAKASFYDELKILTSKKNLYKSIPSLLGIRYISSFSFWYQTQDLENSTKILQNENFVISKKYLDRITNNFVAKLANEEAYIHQKKRPISKFPGFGYQTIGKIITENIGKTIITDSKPFLSELLDFSEKKSNTYGGNENIEETLRNIVALSKFSNLDIL